MVSGFHAGKLERETLHADAALQGSPIKRAGEGDVRGGTPDRKVDGETELVHAQVSADDRGGAALAGEGAGNRAVFFHGEVGGRLVGPLGRGEGKFPFTGDVTLRRILGLLRLANFKSAAVDKN